MKNSFFRAAALCGALIMTMATAGCADTSWQIAESGQWTDGVYSATAEGRNGDFEVTVTIEGGVMVSVEAGENTETAEKGGAAIETLLPEFVSEQTWDVDTVSGATVTSKALKNAVGQCLEEASEEAFAADEE